LNLKSGYPFPLVKSGLPFDYPKLEKNTHTGVLVVGGGISGALMAHHLVEAGFDTLVIDARSIGLGSSCASSSLLQYEIDEPLHQLIPRLGEARALAAYESCAAAITELREICRETGFPHFRLRKSLQLAAKKKDRKRLEQEYRVRKQHGFELEWLEAGELAQIFGIEAPAALLTELAADTDCYLLTHHLHQYNIRRGLRVYDRTKMESASRTRNGFTVHTANGARIRCRKIIYATGYEAAAQLDLRRVKLQSTYVTISEAFSGPPPYWPGDVLIWTTGNPYLYARTTPDHRIMVGGRDEPFIDPVRRDRLIDRKAKRLRRDFLSVFPRIPFLPEFSWTGVFINTPDGLPYIGEFPGRNGEFFALGYGGNGITFSQVAAKLITEMLTRGGKRMTSYFGFDR
jgi:glycine/D-amino acid oxidase-like deaminating enzyme